MIVTFQGYNGKKNGVVSTITAVAAMAAMTKSAKTLVLQLIDKDIDTVEAMMVNLNSRTTFKTDELEFSDDGIDALLRTVDASKLMKADFDSMCTPVLRMENMLDIATVTKSNAFSSMIEMKTEQISNLINNAKDVYENIFILCPSNNSEAVKDVNELPSINKSVYCLTQGHTNKAPVYGKDILYVVTDFETSSYFSLKSVKNMFEKGNKKQRVMKISHNTEFRDATNAGRVLSFVLKNRDLPPEDVNFMWSEDIKNIVAYLMDFNYRDYEVSNDWEKAETTEPAYLKAMDASEEDDDQMSFNLSDLMEDTKDAFEDHSDEPTERLDIEDEPQAGNADLLQQPVTIQIEQPEVSDAREEKKPEKKSHFGFGKKKKETRKESDNLEDTAVENEPVAEPEAETPDMQTVASEMESMFKEPEKAEAEKEVEPEIEEDKEAVEPEVPVEEEPGEKKSAEISKKIWICKSCGTENSGKFCMECGEKKPRSEYWQCPVCGTESKGKFCPECGTKRND